MVRHALHQEECLKVIQLLLNTPDKPGNNDLKHHDPLNCPGALHCNKACAELGTVGIRVLLAAPAVGDGNNLCPLLEQVLMANESSLRQGLVALDLTQEGGRSRARTVRTKHSRYRERETPTTNTIQNKRKQ
eukprot:1423247-Amphidinium_carterae.1